MKKFFDYIQFPDFSPSSEAFKTFKVSTYIWNLIFTIKGNCSKRQPKKQPLTLSRSSFELSLR